MLYFILIKYCVTVTNSTKYSTLQSQRQARRQLIQFLFAKVIQI